MEKSVTIGATSAECGDAALMASVAASDPRAQAVLAERLLARIRRIARSLLGASADAEDATQLALMEILRSAASYRTDGSVERWADRIVVRTAMRVVRKRRLWTTRIDPGPAPDDCATPEGEPARAGEIPKPLEHYLTQLSEPRRTAVVLRHAVGFSVEEIAELTGAPVNTVKDRLLQAREQLRRLIRRDQVSLPRVRSEAG